jgi:hypothetical protein
MSLEVDAAEAQAFVQDEDVQEAIVKTVAEAANVDETDVELTSLSVEDGSGRRLSGSTVSVLAFYQVSGYGILDELQALSTITEGALQTELASQLAAAGAAYSSVTVQWHGTSDAQPFTVTETTTGGQGRVVSPPGVRSKSLSANAIILVLLGSLLVAALLCTFLFRCYIRRNSSKQEITQMAGPSAPQGPTDEEEEEEEEQRNDSKMSAIPREDLVLDMSPSVDNLAEEPNNSPSPAAEMESDLLSRFQALDAESSDRGPATSQDMISI